MKTAELIQKNTKLNKELQKLREDTNQFVQSVLENPANRGLLNRSMTFNQPDSSPKSTQVFLSPNLDFHIFSSMGQIQTLTPFVTTSSSLSLKRKASPEYHQSGFVQSTNYDSMGPKSAKRQCLMASD